MLKPGFYRSSTGDIHVWVEGSETHARGYYFSLEKVRAARQKDPSFDLRIPIGSDKLTFVEGFESGSQVVLLLCQ